MSETFRASRFIQSFASLMPAAHEAAAGHGFPDKPAFRISFIHLTVAHEAGYEGAEMGEVFGRVAVICLCVFRSVFYDPELFVAVLLRVIAFRGEIRRDKCISVPVDEEYWFFGFLQLEDG